MGVCCSSTSKKKDVGSIQTIDDHKLKHNHFTVQQIDKSIEEWVQKTKRRNQDENPPLRLEEEKNIKTTKNMEKQSNNVLDKIDEDLIIFRNDQIINTELNNMNLDIKNLELKNDQIDKASINNSELRDDFDLKKKLHQQNINNNNNFSISSTIHFTGIDYKEIIQKFGKLNNNWINSLKSQSLVNVLEELNLNNFDKKNNIRHDKVKELSIIINDKSKLTIKKRTINQSQNREPYITNSKNEVLSIISNNYNKNVHIESFALQKEKKILSIDEEIQLKNAKNDATIHSASIKFNLEFVQENVFYHVDKLNITNLNEFNKEKRNSFNSLLQKMNIINNLVLPIWNKDIYEKISHYSRKPLINFDLERENIDWKKFNSQSTILNLNDFVMNNFKFIKLGKLSNSSLISAIISVCNYEKKFEKRLISSIVFPQKDNITMVNKHGTYGIKLYFNGAFRYLEVDDRIPFDKITQKPLFSQCQSSDEFWLQLIEKSLLVLYDFKKIKTNPSYEIYHLCGWLPECVLFEDISNRDNLWQRLHTNFVDGNIMVCLGSEIKKVQTDTINSEELIEISKTTNLYHNISYSVLEVVELTDKRILKCKNPLGHTIPSKKFDVKSVKKYKKVEEELEIQKEEENGIFWIEWESVLQHFSNIYLAWNTEIYPYKYHFSSIIRPSDDSCFSNENINLEHNSQYLITIPEHKEDFEMRILLQRNIKKFEENSLKKISFKLFWYEGFPIIYPIDHLRSLPNTVREVNSDVFIFESSNQLEQYVLAILYCNDDKTQIEEDLFTLDVFSFIDVAINEIPPREICNSISIKDNWCNIKGKLGGDVQSPNFVNNPQYFLHLHHTTHLQIKLYAESFNIMICIIEKGNHVSRIPFDYVLSNKNPGFFNNGFSYFECILDPGKYNIVCVTKNDTLIEDFTLHLSVIKNKKYPTGSISKIDLNRLELKSSNYIEFVRGEWIKENILDIKNTQFSEVNDMYINDLLKMYEKPRFPYIRQ